MIVQAALFKGWRLNGVGETANYECLKLYTHLAGQYIVELYAHSAHFDPVKLDRVARGFMIGHENGDYLYLNPEGNFSVWAYDHDGCEVTKICELFDPFPEPHHDSAFSDTFIISFIAEGSIGLPRSLRVRSLKPIQ